MPSALFQLATTRQRQQASAAYSRAPLRRATRDIANLSHESAGEALQTLYRQIARPELRQLITQLERTGGAVTQYAGKSDPRLQLDRLLSLLGPIGSVIRGVVLKGRGDYTRSGFESAMHLIRAFGGEVLVGKGQKGHQRGLAAARQILEEAGYTVTAPGERRAPVPVVGNEGQPHLSRDLHGEAWIYDREHRVSSSSVYSYSFSQETEKFGTLYVTFLAWTPGHGKSHAPGATYAYYDVNLTKYVQFRRAASNSAGEAVWDYLRVRGSAYEHQQPYELVSGVLVQDAGQYIPRKASTKGYMQRAIQDPTGLHGTWARSALPSREYLPERGTPNRGAPNRGR